MSQTIVITGATAGFGKATAEVFRKNGWNIVAIGRRAERLAELKQELGEDILPIALDVRDRDKVTEALRKLPAPFDQPAALLNNAGLALGINRAPNTSLDDWETMVDTNIKGMLYVTQALLPGMVKRNCGHIVNLGSIAGTYPYPGSNVYGATKAFVHQFSLNLRADLLGTAVRVTSLEPGMAVSEFSQVRFKGDTAKADAVYKDTKPLRPEDIAEAVRWVISLPAHVNINYLEMMTINQAFDNFAVHRES